MSIPIRIKRSGIPGKVPTVDQLQSGELALNFYDGDLYSKRIRPGVGTDIVNLAAGAKVKNVLYVTRDGNDINTGKKLGDAKATIKAAVEASEEGTVIRISAGVYEEDNPIKLPPQVSLIGDSLREVTVTPKNPGDLFHVSPGSYISDMSFIGESDPGRAICAFDPDNVKYFAQSPYIRNCTNFIPDSIGLKIDGNYAIGPLKSMVLDSYTQYNQGGIGISITNEGYAQLVSLFTIAPDTAVYVGSGGACDLTNSNSSFGNYGLVADGIGRLKYTGIISSFIQAGNDVFTLDLSTPEYDVSNASYDNTTGILNVTTAEPHKFSVGMGVSIVGLGFTCPFEVGIRTYPSGESGYIFTVRTVAPGRYLDAADSIDANKQEIVDKSLAEIAIQYNTFTNTNFYFPGEDETNERSRYYDATRLIQKNKQEIVDKSLASIAVGFPTGFRFPTDPVPYEQNRYYDASRLIVLNKQEIIDKSLASIAVGFPSGFYFPDEPETNERSRYYDASRLITINKQEIVDKSLASVAIAHSDFYFPGDTQTTIRSRYYDSYRLIQLNKEVIVGTAWTALSINYPDFNYSELKCRRDIGFFVDAVSTDVFTGGNNYSREFVLQYFDGVNPIGLAASERAPSVFAFEQARNLMKQAITNTLVGAAYSDLTLTGDPTPGSYPPPYGTFGNTANNTNPNSCTDVQDNINTLVEIVTVSIGAGNTTLLPASPNFGYFDLSVGIGTTVSPGGVKCARDLGFLVEALATDVFTGGNKYSRDFTLQYFDNNGNPISNGLVGETVESVTAFNALRDYSKKAVTNQLNIKNLNVSAGFSTYPNVGIFQPILPSGNANSCADVQSNIDNLIELVTTVIGAGTTSVIGFPQVPNLGISTTNICARDLGFLIDALATDVFTGGNKYSYEFVLQYFDGATPIGIGSTEIAPSVYAFNSVRDYSRKAITNQLNYKEVGISSGKASYAGAGTSIPVLPSGNPDSCTDVQFTIGTLVGIVTTYIGAGSTVGFPATYNLGISTTNICARDIGFFVDAISTDVFTGGNKYSRDFTKQYFDSNNNLIYLNGENIQSSYAFNSVRDYAKKAVTNQLNYKELDLSVGFTTYNVPSSGGPHPILPSGNPNACFDVQSNIDSLVGIVTNVIGVGTTGNIGFLTTFGENPGTFTAGASKCARDLGYIVDAVSSDVREFTDKNILEATKSYFNLSGTSLLTTGISSEKQESITAFNAVRDYSKKAINNQLNNKNLSLIADPLTGSNVSPLSCTDVTDNIDTLVEILTTFVNAENLNNLPSVSLASTTFSAYVGIATQPHYYNSGGKVKNNVIRPFDGQVVYFGDLYYTVNKINVVSGGSGYVSQPVVTIDPPDSPWGVIAQAVAIVENGTITGFEIVSNGRGYTTTPKVSIYSDDVGINTATATCEIFPTYYSILKSTLPSNTGICTITINENLPYDVGIGTAVLFFKQSRVLASGHSFEFIGSGTEIPDALPFTGGVPIQENETDSRNGGLVVFTSTDQSGNFRIGDGVVVNQNTGTISGTFYSKSLFSTVTPFILALGGS